VAQGATISFCHPPDRVVVDSSADRSDHGRQTQLGCCARGIPEVIPVTLDDSQPGVTQSGYSHHSSSQVPLSARRSSVPI
jgi:hypothetical protein